MADTALHLPTADEVVAARVNIAGYAIGTPLLKLLHAANGTNVFLKLENLQPLGSFKIRPAVNVLKSMDPQRLRNGVLTASAGNFGQGLALAARELGVSATVVVPDTAAANKAAALAELGATVIRVPFNDWWTVLTSRSFSGVGGVFVHPVAESAVLAGNATVAAEIIEELPNIDAVIVPFGGGGLIAGIGAVMRRCKPAVRMIAVESEAAQPAAAALANGGPVRVPHMQSFVDGMGSSCVLEPMWPLVRATVDSAVCASFAQICDAVRVLAARHHVIAEAAGAASVAAAMTGLVGRGNIVCIVSGGNIDAAKLGAILNGQAPF
ncbi:MAG TPA: pyridoxal-phosphate dependent enzyme [Steroidobacteraceae bacterium]